MEQILPKELLATQPIKKFLASFANQTLITAFIGAYC
jgi:hypothetical protein